MAGGGGGGGGGDDMTRFRTLHEQKLRDSCRLPSISRTVKSKELL